jgi:hypothetical protein
MLMVVEWHMFINIQGMFMACITTSKDPFLFPYWGSKLVDLQASLIHIQMSCLGSLIHDYII